MSKNIKRNVPFLDASVLLEDKYIWQISNGATILKRKADGFVEVYDAQGDLSFTLSAVDASKHGEMLFRRASTDAEVEWARALCSAALLGN